MEGSLTMSQRKREHLKVIDRIERQELTVVVAAESIAIRQQEYSWFYYQKYCIFTLTFLSSFTT